MATQNYRSRGDNTVGENSGTSRPVHPARPELPVKAGRENKTPAPIAAPTTTPDMARSTSWGRSNGGPGGNPGAQGYGGPSSLNPGEAAGKATINPQAQTDVVLDNIIRGGTRGAGDDWQTRDLTNPHDNPHGRVPIHSGTSGAASGPTIPAKLGNTSSDHDARIAERLKQGS